MSKAFKNGGSKGNASMKLRKILTLLILVILSSSQTNCARSQIRLTSETRQIKVATKKQGDIVSFDAVCIDRETYKMLYSEATREK